MLNDLNTKIGYFFLGIIAFIGIPLWFCLIFIWAIYHLGKSLAEMIIEIVGFLKGIRND